MQIGLTNLPQTNASNLWIQKGISVHFINRLQRWSIILLAHDFDIRYRRTENFNQAKGLSRLPIPRSTSFEDSVIEAVISDDGREGFSVTLSEVICSQSMTACFVQPISGFRQMTKEHFHEWSHSNSFAWIIVIRCGPSFHFRKQSWLCPSCNNRYFANVNRTTRGLAALPQSREALLVYCLWIETLKTRCFGVPAIN